MQNPMQKIRQSCILFEKPYILPENWNLWRVATSIEFNIFCWNFAHIKKGAYKRVFRIFSYLRPGFYALIFYNFINNTRSKKIKKSQTTLIKLPTNNKKIKLSGFVKETLE